MEDYAIGVVGIAVSVVLFVVTYRQTVGARKERVRSANAEMEKILLRRIILEGYTPEVCDVSRLLEGKARDFRVKPGALHSEAQVLNSAFTRIVENDFVTREQRAEILGRITPVLAKAEADPVDEEAVRDLGPRHARERRSLLVLLTAAFTSATGGIVAVLSAKGFGFIETAAAKPSELIGMVGVIAAASLVVLMSLITFYRLRESQEETNRDSKSSAAERYMRFEREVARILKRAGFEPFHPKSPASGFDFAVKKGKKTYLIEVKAWERPMPLRILNHTIERLAESVRLEEADGGIVVTTRSRGRVVPTSADTRIEVLTLRELRNFLAHA